MSNPNIPSETPFQMPEGATQKDIDLINKLYRNNASIPPEKWGELSPQNHRNIALGRVVPRENIEDEPFMMLASVSKVVFGYLYAQIVQGQELQVQLDLDEMLENLGRAPERILVGREGDSYTDLRDFLSKNGFEFQPSTEDELIKPQLIIAKQLVSKYYDQGNKIVVDPFELLDMSLMYSSNSSTTNIKSQLVEHYGWESLLVEIRELMPNYSPLISTADNRHWSQPDPNVGKLSEVVELMDNLVKQAYNEGDQVALSVLEHMTNNQEEFGFSFSESDLGKELIKKDWKVIEKTGYFPAVTWVRRLAELGFPIHMIINTAVTLVSPDREIVSFGVYDITEMEPPTNATVPDAKGRVFLTASGEPYQEYAREVAGIRYAALNEYVSNYVRVLLNL